MNRAYSLLDIKAFDDAKRTFSGIASTPSVDRMGDVVDPMGAKFTLPMPLLLDHRSTQSVGHVTFARPSEAGIPFTATIATIEEPGSVKDLCDSAWQLVKARLRSFVSIGFSALKYEIMKDGGYQINEWEWLELSLVTIPAQQDAVIFDEKSLHTAFAAVKAFDTDRLAASGRAPKPLEKTTPAGASASRVVKIMETKEMAKPIPEQIASFQRTRELKAARMNELMDAASEAGSSLDATASEEYDNLEADIKTIDEHLVRLRRHEKMNIAAATAVDQTNTGDPARASGVRGPAAVSLVRGNNLPKGTAFTRYVKALAMGKGNLMQALEVAKQWHDETPEVELVLRAAVAAGTTTDTTWASPLVVYQNMASEFIELLRPQTIVGRIQGMRMVPFNIKVPRATGGSTVNWVGEASVKPVSSMTFDQLTLGPAKVAGIIALSEELVRFSSPSAEALVTADLSAQIAQFLDQEFIDPTNSAVTNVSPASVTYGTTAVAATGTTAAALRADIKTLMSYFLAANLSPVSGFWVMTAQQALAISLMVNSLGQPQFPGVTMQGGNLVGFPVIASENVPTVGSSPTDGSRIVFALANQIMMADDGQVTIDVSHEASLQMDSSPDSPPTASTTMLSMWQNNLVAIKAERYINWMKRHDAAVAYLNYTKYAE